VNSREVGIWGLLFDEDNEAKFASHRVTWAEVQQVLDRAPRFYRNRPDRRASIVMIGPTAQGRMLIVPLEELGDGACYPVTAFEPTPQQAGRYRRRTS
jgi:hypothetical protein